VWKDGFSGASTSGSLDWKSTELDHSVTERIAEAERRLTPPLRASPGSPVSSPVNRAPTRGASAGKFGDPVEICLQHIEKSSRRVVGKDHPWAIRKYSRSAILVFPKEEGTNDAISNCVGGVASDISSLGPTGSPVDAYKYDSHLHHWKDSRVTNRDYV
jgi:hypothetical protein